MATNQPPNDELSRVLQQHLSNPGIPILGQTQRRWKCSGCGEIPPVGQMQKPDGTVITAPQSFATQLPEEPGAVFLCMGRCWTNFQRKFLGHLRVSR